MGNDADISDSITDDVAVVVLTHVSYRTGRMLNMARYTQLAHKAYASKRDLYCLVLPFRSADGILALLAVCVHQS